MGPVVSSLVVVGLRVSRLVRELRVPIVALAVLLAHGAAHADIFHCIDAGVHLYRDSPCPTGTRTAGITVSAPVEQRGRQDEDLRNEYERVAAQQLEGLRRIQELERELGELRTALQSMQVAAVPAAVQEPAYPAVPVQQPAYAAIPAQEPVYPAIPVQQPAYTILPAPVVIVPGGCRGRACAHDSHPHHNGVDHRPAQHGAGDRHRERHAELRRDPPYSAGRMP